jgi:hypothetical protein
MTKPFTFPFACDPCPERRSGNFFATRAAIVCLGALFLIAAASASAELPEAATLLADQGLSAEEIAQVQAGKMVRFELKAASDRELVVGLAFHVPVSPADLVKRSRNDLLDRVDATVSAHGRVSKAGAVGDFEKLTFRSDAKSRADAFVNAGPGDALNLSLQELAAFQKLGKAAAPSAVEAQLQKLLLARVQAYRSQGLEGIDSYARAGGDSRSPAEELRTATKASAGLQEYAPTAYQYLLAYPKGQPEGTEEAYRWSQFEAHGVQTVALTHVFVVPDGDARIFVQRQFYVSASYNAEQAIAAFLPAKGGTVVVYSNRTSTDQVTGFGGGAKRSIGSKLLASQIESLFEKVTEALE